MNNGDRIRNMNNEELAKEIYRLHELLANKEYKSCYDVENYLNHGTKPKNIKEAVFDELFG